MADTGRVLQPWWYPNPGPADEPFIGITNPWDICFFNDFALPGVSILHPGRGHKLSIKSSAGKHFATVTDEGYEPCDLTIINTFYSPLHWQIWQLNILPMIEPDPSSKYEFPTVRISHPAAYARRITAIQVKHILGPVPKGKGLMTFTLRCIDFNNSKTNATNTPKNAGVAPFSNALVRKGNQPSHSPIPTKPPREA